MKMKQKFYTFSGSWVCIMCMALPLIIGDIGVKLTKLNHHAFAILAMHGSKPQNTVGKKDIYRDIEGKKEHQNINL